VNIELLELAAVHLGDVLDEVVFLGGATVELWISDEAASEVRATADVDVMVEVTSREQYRQFEVRLEERGFRHDQESGVICRFRHVESELILDAMPLDPAVLGFANDRQREAVRHAVARELPSGTLIRVVTPPHLMATKLEAFRNRGRGDFLGSRDFQDVVALIDGRGELVDEVVGSERTLREYLAAELARIRDEPLFLSGVAGALPPDAASQGRVELVIVPRIDALIDATQRTRGAEP
jgi:hypothetical protein